jgi:hypothetical protein
MPRLCERPACSTPAEVAYGFDAASLVVWLDRFDATQGSRAGALCRRHADAMVVPLGWMLDDRRDPVPRLFNRARMDDLTDGAPRPRPPRQRPDRTIELLRSAVEQLSLDELGRDELRASGAVHEVVPGPSPVEPDEPEEPVDEHPVEIPDPDADEPEAQVLAWSPRFDERDDLAGLLAPRGRLLSRAFRGAAAAEGA